MALPVYQLGKSKRRAFWTGVLSGAVEPLFGALVVLAAAGIHALMPWLLSFAAGAMLYVVAEELLPRARADGGDVRLPRGLPSDDDTGRRAGVSAKNPA